MNASLKEFIEVYAKANNLSEMEVAAYSGAMAHKALKNSEGYTKFVQTLNQVAPHLLQLVSILGNENE